jgi:hypothetical protein
VGILRDCTLLLNLWWLLLCSYVFATSRVLPQVVHMENRADWTTVIRDLKIAFFSFRQLIVRDRGVNSQVGQC